MRHGLLRSLKGIAAVLLASFFAGISISPTFAESAEAGLPIQEKAGTVLNGPGAADGYHLVAEKGGRKLYVMADSGAFEVRTENGSAVWRSSPDGIAEDEIAKGKNKLNLQSLLVLQYGNPDSNTLDTVNSQTGSVLKDTTVVESIEDGFRVTYDFQSIKIRVPLEVTLTESSLCVSVLSRGIEEYGENYLYELQLLPGFDAGGADEDGYILLPDGSGALMDFNNGKSALGAYKRPVYGLDGNTAQIRQVEMTENLLLPLFGIRHAERATLAIITENDGLASINASVSGKTSSYNTVFPSFTVRTTDTYIIGKDTSQTRTAILYSTAPLTKKPLTVEYHLLDSDEGDIGDMASLYRRYLQSKGFLKNRVDDTGAPVYIQVLGAVYKEVPVLGIPVMKEVAVTTYEQAGRMLEYFQDTPVERFVLKYSGWNRDAVQGKTVDNAAAVEALGSKKELRSLLENKKAAVYLDSDFSVVRKWQLGYGKKNYAAKSISNIPTALSVFNIATTFPDKNQGSYWLLSPWKLKEIGDKFLQSYQKLQNPNISLGDAGSLLYSDYSPENKTRDDAKENWAALMESCTAQGLSVLLSGGNAYAAVYADHLLDTPVSSSRCDVFDRDIPFYQMVFHGYIRLAGRAINHAQDTNTALLQTVQTGAYMQYCFLGSDGQDALSGTAYTSLYSTDYTVWKEQMISEYQRLAPLYRRVGGQEMQRFSYLTDKVTLTEYSDGTRVVVNFSDEPFVYNDEEVGAKDYAFWLS